MFVSLKESLSEARVILTRVNFTYQQQDTKQELFVSYLPDLIRIADIFEEHNCLQHKTKCLIYIAKICIELKEYQNSKKYINLALSTGRNI